MRPLMRGIATKFAGVVAVLALATGTTAAQSIITETNNARQAAQAKAKEALRHDNSRTVSAYYWQCPPGASPAGEGQCSVLSEDGTSYVTVPAQRVNAGEFIVGGTTEKSAIEHETGYGSGSVAGAAGEAMQAAGGTSAGYYNPCTDNPFALCESPPSDPRDPRYWCAQMVCPHGYR